MGRSNSRSRSSRSKSRSRSSSRSRSRSHSRKKRYSSRSRSRTYSRSRSRERMYNRDSRDSRDMRDMRDNRDYHRDFRNNRGMRRPYGFRPMRRGFFPGGGGGGGRFMHRGGFRPMWNRRPSRSPRRGRSRSRTPKRRSVSSQRSRSRSRRSYRSSRSPMSSSSGSSSHYSKSPPIRAKKRVSREKKAKKPRTAPVHVSPLNSKSNEEPKDTFERDPSESLDEFSKASGVCGDTWAGLSAYDNSPGTPQSPSLVASPSSLSSSDSDTPILSTAKEPSPRLHSIPHSPASSNNGSARYSPSQNSPLQHMQSKKSPAKTTSAEENRTGELESTKGGKANKRCTDEEARIHLLDRGSTREKAQQKDRVMEKVRKEAVRDWEDLESLDYFNDKASKERSFINVSEVEDFDEIEDYRQFRKSVMAEQGKASASAVHWNAEEEGTKFASKLITKDAGDTDLFREEKPCRVKEASHGRERASTSREREEWDSEKVMLSKANQSPDELKSEKLKDLFNYSPLHKMVSKEKSSFREDSPFGIKMVASETPHPEVKLKMTTVPLEADRSTSLLNDRLLASTLVHSVNKDQEFRSIFDHLKLPQSGKTSSESFIEHIVSLVHYVQEHCFKSSGITLHERFGGYQKAAEEQVARQKSPEIHRRIDISPSALKKHTRLAGEEKTFKEMAPKADKKLKIPSTDKRHEVERRRKQRSKERGNSKGSRESSSSRKQDKLQKEFKEFKLFKEESKLKNKEKERSQSTSSSFSSPENKSSKKEREEDFRIQPEQKEYSGFAGVSRPRGTFFRIRGRGRARGLFAGTNAGPITLNPPPFPKRPPEEEWDPEYTPKSKKYFLHDDRDDGVDYWANRGRGRGTFQRGRGRFTFKKSGSSPKWTHDKYQGDGLLEDDEDSVENNEERMDIRKEEKVDNSGLSVN